MSWGSLLSDGKAVLDIAWWVSFFPGLMIFIVTFCLMQISDFLQAKINTKEIQKG
jgi:peptide/nickel transport system permease protein